MNTTYSAQQQFTYRFTNVWVLSISNLQVMTLYMKYITYMIYISACVWRGLHHCACKCPISSRVKTHYSDVIKWAWLCLKSPASWLFAWPFVEVNINEIIKAPRHLPLWGESSGHQWLPLTKGQSHGKCFHLMMPTCKKLEWFLSTLYGFQWFLICVHWMISLKTNIKFPSNLTPFKG